MDYFDVLMSKINLKKNILIYLQVKITLKNIFFQNFKHTLYVLRDMELLESTLFIRSRGGHVESSGTYHGTLVSWIHHIHMLFSSFFFF